MCDQRIYGSLRPVLCLHQLFLYSRLRARARQNEQVESHQRGLIPQILKRHEGRIQVVEEAVHVRLAVVEASADWPARLWVDIPLQPVVEDGAA